MPNHWRKYEVLGTHAAWPVTTPDVERPFLYSSPLQDLQFGSLKHPSKCRVPKPSNRDLRMPRLDPGGEGCYRER